MDIVVFLDPVEDLLGLLEVFRLFSGLNTPGEVIPVDGKRRCMQEVAQIDLIPLDHSPVVGHESDRPHHQTDAEHGQNAAKQKASAEGFFIVIHDVIFPFIMVFCTGSGVDQPASDASFLLSPKCRAPQAATAPRKLQTQTRGPTIRFPKITGPRDSPIFSEKL